MRYKKAKQIVIKDFKETGISIDFGWKFRLYPRLRKQIKQWSKETIEGIE